MKTALLLLLCTLFLSGLSCGNGNIETTGSPTPIPDPTPPPLGAGEELPESYQYTRTWANNEEIIIMYVWVKGEKYRVDWSLYGIGKNEKMKFIEDSEFKWVYEVDARAATKYSSGAEVHQVDEHMLWFTENYYGTMSEGIILLNMQAACDHDQSCSSIAFAGSEVINGESSRKYTYSTHDGSTITYWISNYGWLVGVVSADATDYTVTMKYADVDLNPSISDDTFNIEKVAPGAEIVDMTAS
jgi:outer membrane lipoprotein-sorting protein